jgi:hypothetical protein
MGLLQFSLWSRLKWFTVAVGSTLLVMILWGSKFAATLSDNIAYSETITGIFSSQGQASLGMSYW